jgi:hypothetical protein
MADATLRIGAEAYWQASHTLRHGSHVDGVEAAEALIRMALHGEPRIAAMARRSLALDGLLVSTDPAPVGHGDVTGEVTYLSDGQPQHGLTQTDKTGV